MNDRTLQSLYAEHQGKVSDKWSLYLAEYDRLLARYRDKPIRFLEIGIQNGGSLDIWAKYFSNASILIGCDINPDCVRLIYDDPRIEVIAGDVNAHSVRQQVLRRSPQFDIIIDDGSHLSSDIIKSFALYFPHVVEGGVFIAEDLHCSYWSQLEGGLFDPYSSISFFKRLADIINHEHWGIPKTRTDILLGIFNKYGCEIGAESLSQVHSVEFINSMCVIHKAPPTSNSLGYRVIAGSVEHVVSGHQKLNGAPYKLDSMYDQSNNPWSARAIPPDEAIQNTELCLANALQEVVSLNHSLSELEGQISCLMQIVSERDRKITDLGQTLEEQKEQITSLSQCLSERDSKITILTQVTDAYQNSTSWKLTEPLRIVGRNLKRIKNIFFHVGVLLCNLRELRSIANKVRNKRLCEVGHQLKLIQSPEYATQVSRNRELSPEYMNAIVVLANACLKVEQWWFSNGLRKKYSGRLASFFFGETKASKMIAFSNLRVHIDKPHGLFKIVDNSLVIYGWSVDLDAGSAAKLRVRIGNVVHQPHLKQREDVQRAFSSVCELPIDVGFAVVPSLSWGLHRMWIDVEGPDGNWIPIRRALLLRMPEIMHWHGKRELSYKALIRVEQKQQKAELSDIKRHIDVMLYKPKFTVVIDARRETVGWEISSKSIREQIYQKYELHALIDIDFDFRSSFAPDTKILQDRSLKDVTGDFIVFIESGQRLSRNALYEFANAINQFPDLDLIYGDEDHLNIRGERCNPFYKPDWSPDYLETFNYIGFPTCFRTTVARGCFFNAHLYDLTLRFTERTKKIWHVRKILGHRDERYTANATAQDIEALQGRLSRTGRCGTVREHEQYRGCYDVELNLKCKPLVSVIIPTAGKTVTVEERQIDLITNVIDQIRNRSTYKNIEIIVVDNGDLSARQQQMIADQGCRRITYTEPIFNISKKMNLGVSIANGELLLLMNDDIEVLKSSWIERMVEHFEKPHVGVVGAKLLYPDGRTQHVGVVHNSGNPDHVRRLFPGNEAGYYFSTCGARNFMAVTGAVMMTPSNVYRAVGGYSEELAVSYNDADYCLKVQEKGLWIVYAPEVVLTHMESQSRVASADTDEVAWYHKRWASQIVSDPYYNELFLTVASPTFFPCVNKRIV